MPDEIFDTNLLRWIAAEIYFSLGMQAAREMFGKGYFALGESERAAVNQAVGAAVRGNYQSMTPESLVAQLPPAQDPPKGQTPKPPVGFQTPKP